MVTTAEQERPISVEQQPESSWLSIREGQKAFVKLSRLAPTLPPDSPLNGKMQEFIERGLRTAMIGYAPRFERGDVDLREGDTTESLLGTIQRGQKAFETEVEQWLPLTHKIARRISERLGIHNNPILELSDLAAAGAEGLMEAVAQYDPARGIPFASRAYLNISGRIIDEVRQNAGVPRSILSFLRKIEGAHDLLKAISGRNPTVEELCKATGLTVEQVNTGLFYLEMSVVSLNRPFITDDGKTDLILEGLQREGKGVPELVMQRWEHFLLAAAISKLRPREQEVIILYYFGGLTIEEIGRRRGVTGPACSHFHRQALEKLRASLAPSGIRPYDPAVGFVKAPRIKNGRMVG